MNFKHPGIINIQTIFNENEDRLYHWAEDRNVPAHNNRSERELRPTVVARKVSFGSQSSQGMKTREILMTYLHTAKKRLKDKPLEVWFKEVLDQIAHNPKCDLYKLLPPLPT
jgi:transposase